jgi:hypothetical protein
MLVTFIALRRVVKAAAIGAAAALVLAQPGAAQSPSIQFSADVPSIPAQMQVYKLTPTRVPLEFLNEKLVAARLPTLRTEARSLIARGTTGAADLDRVRVFADPVTGDTHFIPNLAELVGKVPPQVLPMERLQSVGRAALADARFIPHDVTTARVSDAISVMGAATARGGTAAARLRTAPRTVLTIVPAIRYAGGFRVYGRGSHAAVSLSNDGSIVGALRHWRTASPDAPMTTSLTADQVRANIERQLRPTVAKPGTSATVDKIEVAYYDANALYLSPVLHFEATITSSDKRVSNTKIAGYVPVGTPREPIPDLAAPPSGPRPGTTPLRAGGKPNGAMGAAPIAGDISLGEFANQDWTTSSAYLDMANSFFAGLSSGSQPVSRTIWWTAYPWQVVGSASKQWMNKVNVAYTEPHGDWLFNTTLSNCCDPWSVPNIGTGGNPGYGAAAGGVLATWFIMSCEVVPSMYDRQNEAGGSGNPYTAFDAWWPVFQGLHNVIGFRTEMQYPDDALNFWFGWDAARGGDVNAAWFDEVGAIANYGTYQSQHLIGSPQVRWDRASTMIDARDLGQSIFSVGAQSPSTTLWNFWMNN